MPGHFTGISEAPFWRRDALEHFARHNLAGNVHQPGKVACGGRGQLVCFDAQQLRERACGVGEVGGLRSGEALLDHEGELGGQEPLRPKG